MRLAVLAVLTALVAGGCAMGQATSRSGTGTVVEPGGRTELEISTWRRGTDGPVHVWTLLCPPGGTLPAPDRACSALDALGADAFEPVPPDVACTEIYGGPQVAEVSGTHKGKPVLARFNRSNGCEIDRWDRHRFLFPIRT